LNPLKILFMGSPEFAIPSLNRLMESKHILQGIVTQPDRPRGRGYQTTSTPVKKWADDRNLYVYQPLKLHDEEFYKTLQVLSPDLIVNVAFGSIIPQIILDLPSQGSINLHPSLLPAYRGAAPIQRAIFNGEKVTGVTVLFMEEELDAGNIILQEKESISIEDTAGDLLQRLSEKGADLLLQAINLIAGGKVVSYPQDPGGITYAPMLSREEEIIDWGKSAPDIHNKVRGLSPHPGAYTFYGNSRLKIWKTDIKGLSDEEHPGILPGTVLSKEAEGFKVKTGEGTIKVVRVQPAGKKTIHAAEFYRGYNLKEGTILGKV